MLKTPAGIRSKISCKLKLTNFTLLVTFLLSNLFLPNLTRDQSPDYQLYHEIITKITKFSICKQPVLRHSWPIKEGLIFFSSGSLCSPSVKLQTFSGEGAPKKAQFFSFWLPKLGHFWHKNRRDNHHYNHGYLVSVVIPSFILPNLFLPNLTRYRMLDYSHPEQGSEISFLYFLTFSCLI